MTLMVSADSNRTRKRGVFITGTSGDAALTTMPYTSVGLSNVTLFLMTNQTSLSVAATNTGTQLWNSNQVNYAFAPGVTNVFANAKYQFGTTNSTPAVAASGVTNTLPVAINVLGFTGTSVTQGNAQGQSWSHGTITAPQPMCLPAGGYLTGSLCAAVAVTIGQ